MTWFADLTSSGSMPALEATIRFAGQRQRILSHNIANLTTPDFRPMDVSPQGFQAALSEAISQRRAGGGVAGPLRMKDTRELRVRSDGSLELRPRTAGPGVLAHDRNNADLERLMQDLAENVTVFRSATDLYRSRADLLKTAIAQRV